MSTQERSSIYIPSIESLHLMALHVGNLDFTYVSVSRRLAVKALVRLGTGGLVLAFAARR